MRACSWRLRRSPRSTSIRPSRFPALAYQLIWLYVAFSVGVRAIVAVRPPPFWSVLAVHAVDVVFPCVLIMFAEGPSSPFFVLLPFALLAAGHRWGYRATLVTGAVSIVVLLLDALPTRRLACVPGLEGCFEYAHSHLRG